MVESELLTQYAAVIAALLMLEAALSFDNAAILAAMVRRLPGPDRRKALLYGLAGAYILRIGAILLAAYLLENQWLKFLGGGYLLVLAGKHFFHVARHKPEDEHAAPGPPNLLVRMGVPMLVATIIQIELVDLAFALDQVLAAVAFVEDFPHPDRLYLIIAASVIGILALRLAASVIVRVMDWLPALEHMAYVAVGFVGVKLIGSHGSIDFHIDTQVSLGITLGLFLIPVGTKLLFGWPASAPPEEHEDLEKTDLSATHAVEAELADAAPADVSASHVETGAADPASTDASAGHGVAGRTVGPARTTGRLRITECFYSIQGEGRQAGIPTAFIRTTGCHLRCSWCDATYTFQGGQDRSVEELLAWVREQPTKEVCFTGGEPLLQKDAWTLVDALLGDERRVVVETSGNIDFSAANDLEGRERLCISMDIKCPSSGEHGKNTPERMQDLRASDQLKFVIADREDFDFACQTLDQHGYPPCPVYMNPVGGTDPKALTEWVLESGRPVHVGVQLHKLVWGDEPGR